MADAQLPGVGVMEAQQNLEERVVSCRHLKNAQSLKLGSGLPSQWSHVLKEAQIPKELEELRSRGIDRYS